MIFVPNAQALWRVNLRRRRLLRAAFAIGAAGLVPRLAQSQSPGDSSPGSTVAADYFPRLCLNVIVPDASVYSTEAFATAAGRFNLTLCGPYAGIERSMSKTFATIFSNIASNGKTNGIVARPGHYTMSSEQAYSSSAGNADTYSVWTSAVNTNNWWLRSTYPSGSLSFTGGLSSGATSGTLTTSPPASSYIFVFSDRQVRTVSISGTTASWSAGLSSNVTSSVSAIVSPQNNTGYLNTCSQNTVVDASGRTVQQYYAYHYDNLLRQGKGTTLGYSSASSFAANPSLAWYAYDNVFCQNRAAGAWANNTTNYGARNAEVAAWLQQGAASQIAALRKIAPGILVAPNVDYLLHVSGNFSNRVTLDPTWLALMDIVVCEGVIGNNFISYGSATFARAMADLIATEALCTATGTLLINQHKRTNSSSFTSTSQSSWTASDWQGARFGFCTACLRNWHYCLDAANASASNIHHLDEFGPQGSVIPYMGTPFAPSDPPQTAARYNGVWYRKIVNPTTSRYCVVFVNPPGNGTQSVMLSSLGYSGLAAIASNGHGDNTINTGNRVTSITLNDNGIGDGRVLIH
jgi:hypothetical protein